MSYFLIGLSFLIAIMIGMSIERTLAEAFEINDDEF